MTVLLRLWWLWYSDSIIIWLLISQMADLAGISMVVHWENKNKISRLAKFRGTQSTVTLICHSFVPAKRNGAWKSWDIQSHGYNFIRPCPRPLFLALKIFKGLCPSTCHLCQARALKRKETFIYRYLFKAFMDYLFISRCTSVSKIVIGDVRDLYSRIFSQCFL